MRVDPIDPPPAEACIGYIHGPACFVILNRNSLLRVQRSMAKRSIVMMALPLPFLPLLLLFPLSSTQTSIPARYDGFPYGGGEVEGALIDTIQVEAFFDPLCPDSRDAWPPLKQLLADLSPRVSLIVHPFPLPYHDNSFLACRALHIANKLNASTTYPLLELFFKYQNRYSNSRTHSMSRASVIEDMAKFAATAVGESLLPAFQFGFEDSTSDSAARISFKYGCSRGVTGTPYFFVNGFSLPDAGSALDYKTWRNIIDPLLEMHWEGSRVSRFSF